MTDKFTIRDILDYTLLGLIGIFFFYLHCPEKFLKIISDSKDYSDLTVLLIIPSSYIIGHIIMSVDDLIFNGILYRFLPKETPFKKCNERIYNWLFFGYRNIGARNVEEIDNDTFLKTCDKMIKDKSYDKAEYYQVMSDLFKGIFLVIFTSIIIEGFNLNFTIWKLILLFLTWYRARIFSFYYVRMIKRNII